MALLDTVARRIREARETRATTLHLDHLDLFDIPEEVFALPSLEVLGLSSNHLETIPEMLWDLPHLRRVMLYGNPLALLPNRPGLEIDGVTYVHLRTQFAPENIVGLSINAEASHKKGEFWAAELKTLKNLRDLTIGKWSLATLRLEEDL